MTGTLAGAGSFRCRECGFAVGLTSLDEVPQCPSCGNARFARASLFDTQGLDDVPELDGVDTGDWVASVREGLEEPGHYLASSRGRAGDGDAADERVDPDRPQPDGRHQVRRPDGLSTARDHRAPGRTSAVLDDRSLNGVFLDGERVEWDELLDGTS